MRLTKISADEYFLCVGYIHFSNKSKLQRGWIFYIRASHTTYETAKNAFISSHTHTTTFFHNCNNFFQQFNIRAAIFTMNILKNFCSFVFNVGWPLCYITKTQIQVPCNMAINHIKKLILVMSYNSGKYFAVCQTKCHYLFQPSHWDYSV